MTPAKQEILDNVYVVLDRPMFAKNIGAAAHAVRLTGLGGLRLVTPPAEFLEEATAAADASAAGVLREARSFPDLPSAVADCGLVVGTTARRGGWRQGLLTPRQAAPGLLALARRRPVALIFGREDRGLTNEGVVLCQRLITIPTDPQGMKSINLAQAVLLLGHELRQAVQDDALLDAPPAPAPWKEHEAFLDALTRLLLRVDYFASGVPLYRMLPLRRFFGRATLPADELQAWRRFLEAVEAALPPAIRKKPLPDVREVL